MKGPSIKAAKWRINGVGEEKENHRCVHGKKRDRETDSQRGWESTRMRKVDSEVYTVRRDLINPPELLLEDGPPLLHGRMRYVRRRLCALEGGASFK